ncbi:hypothetical protein BS78_03G305300 [Paspalum vaginatum]|nr:hypothetical protein BS78_03G305300 [Paspalum vaginatum]
MERMGDPHACAHQPRAPGVPPLLRRHPQAQRLRHSEPAPVARLPAGGLHRHLRARVPLPDARAQGRRHTVLQEHTPHPGLLGALPPPPPGRPGHHHRLLHRGQRALEAPPAQPNFLGCSRCLRVHQVAPWRRYPSPRRAHVLEWRRQVRREDMGSQVREHGQSAERPGHDAGPGPQLRQVHGRVQVHAGGGAPGGNRHRAGAACSGRCQRHRGRRRGERAVHDGPHRSQPLLCHLQAALRQPHPQLPGAQPEPGHVPAPHAGAGVQDYRDRAVAHVRHPALQGGGDTHLVRPPVPMPDAPVNVDGLPPLQRAQQGRAPVVQPHRCLHHQHFVWRSAMLGGVCHRNDAHILLDIRRSARLQFASSEQSGLPEHPVFSAGKPGQVVQSDGPAQSHQFLPPGQTDHAHQGLERPRAQRTLGQLAVHPARRRVVGAQDLGVQGAQGQDDEHRGRRELPQVQQPQGPVGAPVQGLLQGARVERRGGVRREHPPMAHRHGPLLPLRRRERRAQDRPARRDQHGGIKLHALPARRAALHAHGRHRADPVRRHLRRGQELLRAGRDGAPRREGRGEGGARRERRDRAEGREGGPEQVGSVRRVPTGEVAAGAAAAQAVARGPRGVGGDALLRREQVPQQLPRQAAERRRRAAHRRLVLDGALWGRRAV